MKKLLILLLVFGLASAASALPAPQASCGFNSGEDSPAYTLGALIGQGSAIQDWAGPFTDNSGGRDNTGRFEVVEGGCSGSGHSDPDQHLQMFDADSSGYSVERAMDPWEGDFTYELCHKWNSQALVTTMQHQFENSSGARPLNIKWEASGQFRVNDSFLINWKNPADPFKNPLNNWVDIKVVCDYDTATFDLYWETTDNTMGYVGQKIGFKDTYSGDVVNYRLDAPKMNTTDGQGLEVDHIRITPEPTTIMLLGLGGLALIRRKR